MNIEDNIFKNSIIDLNKLIDYGFKKQNNSYIYIKDILDNTFKVEIIIDKNNKVKGKIFDLECNEEYINFRIENIAGEFVNNIRNEYENILLDIKKNCFKITLFISNQANRISKLIYSKYKDEPEFLWKKYPTDGIFRNKNSNKWYCLIMKVTKDKIDKGNEEIEIMNVKLKEDRIKDLLLKDGFYEAYHMNKKYWITIILDDTLTDNEIINYINESYELTK